MQHKDLKQVYTIDGGNFQDAEMFKGTQDWDFFGFDFEICIISLIVMSKY